MILHKQILYKIAVNYLLSSFFMLFIFLTRTIKIKKLMLQCMDLNVSSMSESLAISLALEWKILLSILVLQSKINIVRTLNFFSSLKNYFNLFLVIDLGLISCNSGSK